MLINKILFAAAIFSAALAPLAAAEPGPEKVAPEKKLKDHKDAAKENAPSRYPAWRTAMAEKDTWGTATATTLASIAPEASAQVDVWNGAAAHGGKVWFGLGGGHHGGSTNSIWQLDLNLDQPKWTKLHAGSDPSQIKAEFAYYNDGLPGTRHTYYTPHFITGVKGAHDRVMYFGNGGFGGEANAPTADGGKVLIEGFDLVTKKWDPKGTWASIPMISVDISWGSPTAIDPRTEDIWIYASGYTGYIYKWTKATNSWRNYGAQKGMSQSWWYKASVIDAKRDLYILQGKLDSFNVMNLTTMVSFNQQTTGFPPKAMHGDYPQLIHDTINDRYLMAVIWHDASGFRQSLFAIDPTTWVSTHLNELPDCIAGKANGIMGRLAFHPTLGGLSWTAYSASPTYFMPLTGKSLDSRNKKDSRCIRCCKS